MNKRQIVSWLERNPARVRGVPEEIVARCESDVRQHAAEAAWQAAEAYVEGRMHEWEQQWGQHATESDTAREVCSLLASELRRHEPKVQPGDEVALAGEDVLGRLDPEAREVVGSWVRELAGQVEHAIWKEIVRFTRRDGRRMVRAGRVSSDHAPGTDDNYAHQAAHVAALLIEDYHMRSGVSRPV